MKSIDGTLLDDVRNALIDCHLVETDMELRELFIDNRISTFRIHLRQTSSLKNRVDSLIYLLCDAYDKAGRNGLALFLEVARDRQHHEDACYNRLDRLVKEVEASLRLAAGSRSGARVNELELAEEKDTSSIAGARPPGIRRFVRWGTQFLRKVRQLFVETTSAVVSAGIAGLIGGIWIWVLGLPWASEIGGSLGVCSAVLERPFISRLLPFMILGAGGVGGAGFGMCVGGSYQVAELFFPRWAKRPSVYQGISLLITAGLMTIGGILAGGAIGMAASITIAESWIAIGTSSVAGAILGGILGALAGGGVALAIVVAIRLAESSGKLPFQHALSGGIVGALAGVIVLSTATFVTDVLMTAVSPLNETNASCVILAITTMVTSGPLKWIGGPVVGGLVVAVVAAEAGKRSAVPAKELEASS